MTRSRSRRAACVTVLAAAVLLATPSIGHADTTSPGAYHAKADATALNLKVFGQGLTLGLTHAENLSEPKSLAAAIGALLPGLGNQVEQNATATAAAPDETHTEMCGPISLPADFPVVDLATACTSATAVVDNGLPSSSGNATVAKIDVNGNAVLGQAASQLNQPIGSLIDGLKPVFSAVDQTGIDANTLLNKIVSAITQDGDLVRITLGPSNSASSADQNVEGATAAAQGAVIQVLPREALQLSPVVTIDVGAASNAITINRSTGKADVNFEPSLVKVTLADDIAATLPEGARGPFTITPGVSQCLGLPAPLDSCITVAGGTKGTRDDGVTYGDAAGVSLHLLTGVQDGVRLDLANTHVEGLGALEVARSDTPADSPPLARTGGSVPLPLVATLAGVGLVAASLSRTARRRELLP